MPAFTNPADYITKMAVNTKYVTKSIYITT